VNGGESQNTHPSKTEECGTRKRQAFASAGVKGSATRQSSTTANVAPFSLAFGRFSALKRYNEKSGNRAEEHREGKPKNPTSILRLCESCINQRQSSPTHVILRTAQDLSQIRRKRITHSRILTRRDAHETALGARLKVASQTRTAQGSATNPPKGSRSSADFLCHGYLRQCTQDKKPRPTKNFGSEVRGCVNSGTARKGWAPARKGTV
jgi:hypothetical protein